MFHNTRPINSCPNWDQAYIHRSRSNSRARNREGGRKKRLSFFLSLLLLISISRNRKFTSFSSLVLTIVNLQLLWHIHFTKKNNVNTLASRVIKIVIDFTLKLTSKIWSLFTVITWCWSSVLIIVGLYFNFSYMFKSL